MTRLRHWEGWSSVIVVAVMLTLLYGMVRFQDWHVRHSCHEGHHVVKEWNYVAKMPLSKCVENSHVD